MDLLAGKCKFDKAMKIVDISIVIRTLNEGRYLGNLLDAINHQKCDFNYEVVLIDSGSTDQTLFIAKKYGCRILHISREEFSFGRSLNRACQASAGKYLILISGHCVPTDTMWMQNLADPLNKGIADYVYGRQIGGPDTYWSESQIFDKYFSSTNQLPQTGFYCNNANSIINRDAWELYKFDEELTGLEDMHLAKRLATAGGSIGYVAEACVYHLHHENWSQIRRRFEREALALQQICPEVIVRRRDFIRYFVRAVIQDTWTSKSKALNIRHLFNIFAYRYFQYRGSFKGNKIQKMISNQLRDSYFYPTQSKGTPLTSR